MLTALKLFTSGAYDRELADMLRTLQQITNALAKAPVQCQIIPSDGQSYPLLHITLKGSKSAFEVCRALRRGKPSVQVGHGELVAGKLVINPLHLNDERTAALCRRLQEEFAHQP